MCVVLACTGRGLRTGHRDPVLGNSYTSVNDLTGLVQLLAQAEGHSVVKDLNAPGGNTLGAPQTSGSPHSMNPVSISKINSADWDFVVLQEQSVIPALPNVRAAYMLPGGQDLQALISANFAGTTTLLYQTWGRRDPGTHCWTTYCGTFASFNEMQDALTEGYDELAALIGATVVPVGEAWRRAFALAPEIELHSADGIHPSFEGTYLSACVFFAKIFNQSPEGSSFIAHLDPGTAAFLQRVAAETVFGVTSSFCTAKTTNVCGPANLSANGLSSATATSGFVLKAQPVRGCRAGLLLYSNQPVVTGVPFGGPGDGVLCLTGMGLRRAGPIQTGSMPQFCDGTLAHRHERVPLVQLDGGRLQSSAGTDQPRGLPRQHGHHGQRPDVGSGLDRHRSDPQQRRVLQRWSLTGNPRLPSSPRSGGSDDLPAL